LARWNGLRKGRALVPGRQLVVFVPVAAPAPRAVPTTPAMASVRKLTVPARLPSPLAKPPVAKRTTGDTVEAVAAALGKTPEAVALTTEVPVGLSEARPSAASALVPAALAVEAVETSVLADSLPAGYVVRKGDYLSRIAEIRGLSVKQVMAWNKLTSEKVVPGQKLVFVAPAAADTAATAAASPGRKSPRPAPVAAALRSDLLDPIRKVHLVQAGDTLYNISRRYQGVTVAQLKRLNNLTSDEVKPGQKLIVAR
ncbi:MAG: LysM peptidoglycan-binding domain-containing protein, partial [Hymenobacter sp.]|nr:LysM peptidoglycan-binding domain-containing protein [Hymenobacter sp.]